MKSLEAAFDLTFTKDLPSRDRISEALDGNTAQVAVLKEFAGEPPRARGYNNRVGLGNGLKARRQIGGFTDDTAFLRFATTDQITNNHRSGANSDADLQHLGGWTSNPADCLYEL